MTEGRLIKYMEMVAGALVMEPVISYFGVALPPSITQYLLSFIIAYIVIEEFKRTKEKIDKYLSNKVKDTVKKEMKHAKKK